MYCNVYRFTAKSFIDISCFLWWWFSIAYSTYVEKWSIFESLKDLCTELYWYGTSVLCAAHGNRFPLVFIQSTLTTQRYIEGILIEGHALSFLQRLENPPSKPPELLLTKHVWDMIRKRLRNLTNTSQTQKALRNELRAWEKTSVNPLLFFMTI